MEQTELAEQISILYHNLCTFASRFDPRSPDDLVQEAVLIALSRLNQLKNVNSFRAWMQSIIRTEFLKRRRKKKPTFVETVEVESDEPGALELLLIAEDLAGIRAYISDDEKMKQTLEAVIMFGWDAESEIAKHLNITVDLVYTRKKRLKQHVAAGLSTCPPWSFSPSGTFGWDECAFVIIASWLSHRHKNPPEPLGSGDAAANSG